MASPAVMEASPMAVDAVDSSNREGLKQYYITKIEELQLTVSEKSQVSMTPMLLKMKF